MNKKLPGVFANKIDKELHNNDCVYYSSKESIFDDRSVKEMDKKDIKPMNTNLGLNINQKINKIFNSSKYVYKANVRITTKDGEYIKKIIGQNKTHLITMDNELIPISDIIDIDFSN